MWSEGDSGGTRRYNDCLQEQFLNVIEGDEAERRFHGDLNSGAVGGGKGSMAIFAQAWVSAITQKMKEPRRDDFDGVCNLWDKSASPEFAAHQVGTIDLSGRPW